MNTLKNVLQWIEAYILTNRVKAFAWGLAMQIVAGGVQAGIQYLNEMQITEPSTVTMVLGLILAQVSKHLNNLYQEKKGLR